MFDKIKDAAPKPAPTAAPVAYRPPSANETSDAVTSIGSSVTVVGKISGEGAIKIYGRVEGEISASSVFVCADAHVEGNINAQDLTVGGIIKGTMQAQSVKLLSTANVEGDIFHQSLTIEQNARFEGSSRRKDNISDKPAAQAKPAVAPASYQTPTAVVQQMPQAGTQPIPMARASEG
jgi:cytoskeletal protein CcmA (bactofilin family)